MAIKRRPDELGSSGLAIVGPNKSAAHSVRSRVGLAAASRRGRFMN